MSALGPSIVRTLVPLLVTLIGPWVAENMGIDGATLTSVLSVVLAGVYYLAVRLLELHVAPRFGWALGWPAAPAYEPRHAA